MRNFLPLLALLLASPLGGAIVKRAAIEIEDHRMQLQVGEVDTKAHHLQKLLFTHTLMFHSNDEAVFSFQRLEKEALEYNVKAIAAVGKNQDLLHLLKKQS